MSSPHHHSHLKQPPPVAVTPSPVPKPPPQHRQSDSPVTATTSVSSFEDDDAKSFASADNGSKTLLVGVGVVSPSQEEEKQEESIYNRKKPPPAAAAASMRPPTRPTTSSGSDASFDAAKARERQARQVAMAGQGGAAACPYARNDTDDSDADAAKRRARQERQDALASGSMMRPGAVAVTTKKAPPAAAATSGMDEKARVRQERLAAMDHMGMKPGAVAVGPDSTAAPAASGPVDEKARIRQERLAAMDQMTMKPGAVSVGPPSAVNNSTTANGSSDAKARARATAVGTMRPSFKLTGNGDNHMAASSLHSTSSSVSTAVTHNTPHRTSTSSSVSRDSIKAVNLMLEEDGDFDGVSLNVAKDKQVVKQQRNSGTARKLKPPPRTSLSGGSGGTMDAQRLADEFGGDLSDSGDDDEEDDESRFQKALRRSQSLTPNQVSRAHNNNVRVGAMAVTGGNRQGKSDSSVAVGAQSMTGGRRLSKFMDGDEEDGVHMHLASLARQQTYNVAASTGVRLIEEEEVDVEDDWNQTLDDYMSYEKEDELAKRRYVPSTSGETMAVAQVGLPVVQQQMQPGAFAVEGIDAHNNDHEDDDGGFEDVHDDDLVEVGRMERGGSVTVASRHSTVSAGSSGRFDHPSSSLTQRGAGDSPMDVISAFYEGEDEEVLEFYDDQGGLQAELHQEAILVDAQVFDDNALSSKTRRRLRRMQGGVFCMAMASIAAVIAVSVNRPEAINPWNTIIPTIKGWSQVGQNLTGSLDDDKSLFGYTVAIAGNAVRMAIGMPGFDLAATELLVGEVQIYDWNGTDWLPSFGENQPPLVGPGPEAQAGTAIAMSKDGTHVAVGSPFYSGGHVVVYAESEQDEQWKPVGQALLGDNQGDRFGGALALSDNGQILVVGASMGGEQNQGYVKAFRLDEHQWVPMGGKMYGDHPGDFFGWSVTTAKDGSRVSIGAVGSTGNSTGEFAGVVTVFDYDGRTDSWKQPCPAIPGESAFDSFGSAVKMNEKGNILAVGAIGHSSLAGGVDIGQVRVFRFDEEHPDGPIWIQQGQTLEGQSDFDSFGYSVSLSSDGGVVAAGGPQSNEFADSSGQIQVHKWDEDTAIWQRVGGNIGGSYVGNELFGWSVSLSSDGSRLAGGAPFYTHDGRINGVGSVRVYDVDA